MPFDVSALRRFYASPQGELARRQIAQIVRRRFSNCVGLSVLGLGYATPYLDMFRDEAVRAIALMPARQGVMRWPTEGLNASGLVEPTALPLPDSSIDRAILIHGLETDERQRDLLAEAWRVLTPNGRLLIVAPSRSGFWARAERTPFGHGQPFSRGQLRELMRETLFEPAHWDEALHTPPFRSRALLRLCAGFEKIAALFGLPGAGVVVVEATKQLYRPVPAGQRAQESAPQFVPAAEAVGVAPVARAGKAAAFTAALKAARAASDRS
ncbi:class I SAM-dependent methyltransferase [Methylocella sp.]|uniref:class I SAM-dependent methyltransferase n=1 Tax=Methylocella sp. TaxID=1978226 RepID=UPI003784463D